MKLFAGIVGVGLAVWVAVTLAGVVFSDASQPAGLKAGQPLPEFAAPLATGPLDGDANVTPRSAPTASGRPACSVDLPGAITVCGSRPTALLFWFRRGGGCVADVGEFDRVARETSGVRMIAVAVSEQRADIAPLVTSNRWSVPVVVDPDGAVGLGFGVAGCPTYVFARDGKVTAVLLGRLTPMQLQSELKKTGSDHVFPNQTNQPTTPSNRRACGYSCISGRSARSATQRAGRGLIQRDDGTP